MLNHEPSHPRAPRQPHTQASGPGTVLDGRYALRREIASSATSELFEAEHCLTGRTVAIKRMRGDAARQPRSRERFAREVRFLAKERSPHFVEVLDAGEDPTGALYMVMERLEGRSLDGLLAVRPRLPIDTAVHIAESACDALTAAHARGVVHRNVKPSNLYLVNAPGEPPRVKLMDFGIALSLHVDGGHMVTRGGELLGTAEYMAPEQHAHEALDARTDVYALGITLYEALTGEVPFSGTYPEVVVKVSTGTFRPLRELRPDVPLELEEAIARAFAYEPAARYADARSFREALEAALAHVGEPAPAAPSVAPRRRHARAAYTTPVRVLRSKGAPLDGRSEDISEGGMLLIAPKVLSEGERVTVRFAAPLRGGIVELVATARWIVSARGGRGATGLEFREAPQPVRAEIARYVELLGAETDDPAAQS